MQQINESILNDEIREHLKENRISHMEYLPGMERISSDLLEQVTSRMDAYDPARYTAGDVRRALAQENRTPEDFAALLSPAAAPFLEELLYLLRLQLPQ